MTQLDAIATVEAFLALADKLEAIAPAYDRARFNEIADGLREAALRQAAELTGA